MERCWRFAEELFPPLGDGDGMSEQRIADAEALVDELVQDHLAAGADPDEDFDDEDLGDAPGSTGGAASACPPRSRSAPASRPR